MTKLSLKGSDYVESFWHEAGDIPPPVARLFTVTFGYAGIQKSRPPEVTEVIWAPLSDFGRWPNKLRFSILPPLAGMVTQPLISCSLIRAGYKKTRTANTISWLVAVWFPWLSYLLPNTGSLGFGYGSAMALWFGARWPLLFMDPIGQYLQPFKMLIWTWSMHAKQMKPGFTNIWGSLGGVIAFVFHLFWLHLSVAAASRALCLIPFKNFIRGGSDFIVLNGAIIDVRGIWSKRP